MFLQQAEIHADDAKWHGIVIVCVSLVDYVEVGLATCFSLILLAG